RAIRLARTESRFPRPVRLDRDGREPLLNAAVLHAGRQRLCYDLRAQALTVDARAQELRIGPPRNLVESFVEHLLEQPLDETPPVVADLVLGIVRTLAEQRH